MTVTSGRWWRVEQCVFQSVDFYRSRHLHIPDSMKNDSITISHNAIHLVFHLFRKLLWHCAVISSCFDNIFLMGIRAKAKMRSLNALYDTDDTADNNNRIVLLQSLEFVIRIFNLLYIYMRLIVLYFCLLHFLFCYIEFIFFEFQDN